MNDKFERFKYNISNIASRFFKKYKNYLLVFFIIFLFGFLTGIFTCSSYASDLSCENLINKYLYNFLCNSSTFLSYFLTITIYFLILCSFTIFCVKNKFLLILDMFVLFLIAYVFGFDLCIVVVCLGLSGIILGIIFLGIFGVLGIFNYLCIMSIVAQNVCAKDGCKEEFKCYFKNCLIFVFLAIVILFLSCLFFSIIHIFVIVE